MRRKSLLLVLFLGALAASGCFNASEDDQSVPWSRPADWERNAPGFGG
ncbi:MAG: hypothetical protein ACOCVJ_03645 [Verrucomicrobiota bacterium]